MMRLHPAFLAGLLRRSAIIWVGVRGLLLFAGLLVPTLPAAVVVVTVTAFLTTLDGRRHSETVLLANLGVPEWQLVLLAMVPPSAIEVTIQVLM